MKGTPWGRLEFNRLWATIRDVEENSRSTDFVELHADRLFGFAMIVTLGDATLAGKLAAEALANGVDRIEQLRHPVRAAAWLRAAVRKGAGRPAWGHRRPGDTERRDALQALGVDDLLAKPYHPVLLLERIAWRIEPARQPARARA